MKFIVLLALLSTLLSVFSAGAQQSLTFREPTPGPMVNYVTAVLEEAYADLGVELNYQPLPRLRAEQLAESGEIAGELGRLANLEEQLPSLNRVPFRLYEFSIVLVAKRSECGLCTIKAIDSVAHVSGMRAAEKVLEDADFDRPVFQQTKFEQVAKLLNSGRIDAALIADFQLRNLTLENPGDYVIYRLRDDAGYHYLHDSYKHLIEPLYQRLSAMKASGRLAELKKQYQLELPDQLRPIDMPTQFVAASSIQPGLTNADGSGSLWELISQLLANAVDELETSASNWPRARNLLLEQRAHLLVGVQKHQFEADFIYSELPIAMDDALYLFTTDDTVEQELLSGNQDHTVCYSGSDVQRTFLPKHVSYYKANAPLDCFAMLDLNRVDGVIDYKHNLPDWTEKPYRRERLRDPVPLYLAFNNNEIGQLLKAHLDRALKSQLPPGLVGENRNTVR